ncbi:hypothetical protein O3M35_010319 [Rhynocoris fuscipes]|uniref:RNA helicase n=1 Tax=Rhynocoris fuscipes TaxID=488301 RepID=A0AAW1CYG2_9HEMI
MNTRFAHDLDDKSRTQDILVVQDVVFPSFLLPDFILRGLEKYGYKKPSPIQLSAIPLARCGLDLIVQAKSGTGKTLVFTITVLETVKVKLKRLQAIILAPTREIAIQITVVIKAVGCYLKGLKVGTFIGGMPMEGDKHNLSGCHVAVGAPGRVRHLIEQNIMDSSAVRLLILDEADKLMEEIFLSDVNYIFNKCCSSKQTLACSATYTPELLEFVNQYMRSGKHIVPDGNAVPILLGLKQFVYITDDHANIYARLKFKQEALFKILTTVRFDQALVFTNYITRAESLSSLLNSKGWSTACLTGKQTQEARNETVERLKCHKASIVVATDLASRGLDSSSINLVINLDVPLSGATYLHRMGRAGRYGSHGICITIVSEGQDCTRFTNMLGDIGGSSMYVSLIPRNNIPDLWTTSTDGLQKLYATIKANDEEISPSEVKNDQLALESASSPIATETGSVPATSDQEINIKTQATSKKALKIGSRVRKFSNSMREQIEGADSSDSDQINFQKTTELMPNLSFTYLNINDSDNISNNSSSSQNSYKPSDEDEEDGEEMIASSNLASSDTLSIEEGLEQLNIVDEKSYPYRNIHSKKNHSYYKQYYQNSLQNQFYNNSLYENDWYFRIENQIQNFVQYTHKFNPYF